MLENRQQIVYQDRVAFSHLAVGLKPTDGLKGNLFLFTHTHTQAASAEQIKPMDSVR